MGVTFPQWISKAFPPQPKKRPLQTLHRVAAERRQRSYHFTNKMVTWSAPLWALLKQWRRVKHGKDSLLCCLSSTHNCDHWSSPLCVISQFKHKSFRYSILTRTEYLIQALKAFCSWTSFVTSSFVSSFLFWCLTSFDSYRMSSTFGRGCKQ